MDLTQETVGKEVIGYIMTVGVDKKYRRHGAGSLILSELCYILETKCKWYLNFLREEL